MMNGGTPYFRKPTYEDILFDIVIIWNMNDNDGNSWDAVD